MKKHLFSRRIYICLMFTSISLVMILLSALTEHFGWLHWGKDVPFTLYLTLGVLSLFGSLGIISTYRKEKKLSSLLIKHLNESVMIIDRHFNFLYVNETFERMTGFKYQEVIGKKVSLIQKQRDLNFYKQVLGCLKIHGYWEGEFLNTSKHGEELNTHIKILTLNHLKRKKCYIILQSDIHHIKLLEKENQKNIYYSGTTNLPNDRKFEDDFKDLSSSEGEKTLYCCKIVNQVQIESKVGKYGFSDSIVILAKTIAEKLQDTQVVIYKADYNSLAFLLNDKEICIDLIEEIIKEASHIEVNHISIKLNLKFGISKYPEHANGAEELLMIAQVAINQIIDKNHVSFNIANQAVKKRAIYQADIENDLLNAIKNEELFVYYQPQIDVKHNTILGFEALARWRHPIHGFVSPELFIEVAEKNGYMPELDEFIFTRVFKDYQEISLYKPDIRMSINLSSQQFVSSKFLAMLSDLLTSYQINPKNIVLELTENQYIDSVEIFAKYANEIKNLGCQLSLDDFGTGYNAISLLFNLPFNEIKLDRSYIRQYMNHKDIAIIKSMIALSESINISHVVEGVETHKQKELLLSLGSQIMQGYLFSEPMSVEKIKSYIENF